MTTIELQHEFIINILENQLAKAQRNIEKVRSVICVVCYEEDSGSFYNETGWAGNEGTIKTSFTDLLKTIEEEL